MMLGGVQAASAFPCAISEDNDYMTKTTEANTRMQRPLEQVDPQISSLLREEAQRQATGLELIPSENLVSEAVLEAMGSIFTNKYAEGYPGKRYYGGCEFADKVEQLAIDRAKQLFGAEHANVQSHSGTQANVSVYMSALQPGDVVLGMNLSHGGHLTHGHPLNFSGRMYKFVAYGVRQDNEQIDYDEIAKLATEHKPKMIVAGASAYSRIIDFPRIAAAAKSVGALFFVDMAHIAGLVAAGVHPSPVPHADFVSTTTHKTLRGPRGGLVLCKAAFQKELDKLTFPGLQGGPLVHTIAAKAVCLQEAMEPSFKEYQQQVAKNAKALAAAVAAQGFRIVSGGTDNHLFLVDVHSRGITGTEAEKALDRAGITVNKNAIPFDPLPPMKAGGIRLGTPSITTRGMKESEMAAIAGWIAEVLAQPGNTETEQRVRKQVAELAAKFPIYESRVAGQAQADHARLH
ncbi:MAG TPA: serine hydroxymethyltransferase [Candidatus Acidoferrum sp.]|jgi:glycine hydroxymethyltransferase